MLQRYVSKELTHFVGRSLASDDERYDLLLKILKEGKIKAPFERDNQIWSINIDPEGSFSKETMIKTLAVCFCDIPVDDLSIHMNKYGKFGLAFTKDFLIEKKANPIFYVATDSRVSHQDKQVNNLGDLFEKELSNCYMLFDKIRKGLSVNGCDYNEIEKNLTSLYYFFVSQILPFLKPFECCRSESDEENYYMEREWRVLGFVEFKLDDISRIILPKSYIERFKGKFPDYDRITPAEDCSLSENISTESETT